MRQAVMTAPGKIEFREAPELAAGPGEARLRVRRIGVCGSDVHVNHGRHPFTRYPVVQGHEFCGEIESLGEGVRGLKVGGKATAMPQVVCGKCPPCLRGDYHICDHLKVEGFQAPGCAQDLFVTNAKKIVPLPEEFTFEQGALVEPVAVAVHAVGRAGYLAGRNVAVLGAGPIGNLVAQAARCEGARPLIVDINEFRLDVAKQCGIAAVSNANEEPLARAARRVFGAMGFDVAFECAGAEASLNAAIESIAKGGTIVIVGVFGSRPAVNMALVQDRELSLIGTLMYQYSDYEKAVEAIASGGIATVPLDSKHFPFEEFASAYRFIDEQGGRSMKVFIDL